MIVTCIKEVITQSSAMSCPWALGPFFATERWLSMTHERPAMMPEAEIYGMVVTISNILQYCEESQNSFFWPAGTH